MCKSLPSFVYNRYSLESVFFGFCATINKDSRLSRDSCPHINLISIMKNIFIPYARLRGLSLNKRYIIGIKNLLRLQR